MCRGSLRETYPRIYYNGNRPLVFLGSQLIFSFSKRERAPAPARLAFARVCTRPNAELFYWNTPIRGTRIIAIKTTFGRMHFSPISWPFVSFYRHGSRATLSCREICDLDYLTVNDRRNRDLSRVEYLISPLNLLLLLYFDSISLWKIRIERRPVKYNSLQDFSLTYFENLYINKYTCVCIYLFV